MTRWFSPFFGWLRHYFGSVTLWRWSRQQTVMEGVPLCAGLFTPDSVARYQSLAIFEQSCHCTERRKHLSNSHLLAFEEVAVTKILHKSFSTFDGTRLFLWLSFLFFWRLITKNSTLATTGKARWHLNCHRCFWCRLRRCQITSVSVAVFSVLILAQWHWQHQRALAMPLTGISRHSVTQRPARWSCWIKPASAALIRKHLPVPVVLRRRSRVGSLCHYRWYRSYNTHCNRSFSIAYAVCRCICMPALIRDRATVAVAASSGRAFLTWMRVDDLAVTVKRYHGGIITIF